MSAVYVQGCRFDYICKKSGKYSEAKGSHCLHGGGCDCKTWKRLTDAEMGWDRTLPGRSWSNDNNRRERF